MVLVEDIGKAIDNGKGKTLVQTMGGGHAHRDEGGRQGRPDRCVRRQGDDRQGRSEALERRRPLCRCRADACCSERSGSAAIASPCLRTAFPASKQPNARYKRARNRHVWGQGRRMKATIERATLLKSLSHVQSVVERRNTIPILSNVLIEAQRGRLAPADGDRPRPAGRRKRCRPMSTQAGATTVSAHTLFDIVRKLPEGSQVELTAAEGKMQVNAGRARFNLSTLPRDDFPVIAEGELPTRFELPAATLRQIIDKTRFAISTEETRYYLMGIFLHVADDAAEGRRDRRPPARPRHRCQARRRRRHARRDRAAEMRRRAPQAARRARGHGRNLAVADQGPLRPRQRGADQQADRRHLPRLQPRHPDRRTTSC